ncbi:MAG: HAD-IB family phosphatase [Thermoplasmatota archaeon]|nr:HAD-IB family phosphatase [Candidatus Thermoplasmatota archaeon]MBU1913817.1 HAD-IB family phosphatase [Candidatus Thermoplasmatota archaeon]
MARLVVFDMDGVLADTESSWVHVHKHFGVNNDHSLYAYLRGEIDDLEFIRRDIDLWKKTEPDVTEACIREILNDVPIMPGAHRTIRELKRIGIGTAIVSAGIDLLAERISKELGVDAQLANGLVKDGAGRLSGEGILRVKLMDKGDAVTEVANTMKVQTKDVVAVGNSRYDVSMFRRAGLGIAFQPSDDFVRTSAQVVVQQKDLSMILQFIRP